MSHSRPPFPSAPALADGSVEAARLRTLPGRPGPKVRGVLFPCLVTAFPTLREFIISISEGGRAVGRKGGRWGVGRADGRGGRALELRVKWVMRDEGGGRVRVRLCA